MACSLCQGPVNSATGRVEVRGFQINDEDRRLLMVFFLLYLFALNDTALQCIPIYWKKITIKYCFNIYFSEIDSEIVPAKYY